MQNDIYIFRGENELGDIEIRLKIVEEKIKALERHLNTYSGYGLSPLRTEFVEIEEKYRKKTKGE